MNNSIKPFKPRNDFYFCILYSTESGINREQPSNDQSSSLLQSKAELDQLRAENDKLQALLHEQSDKFAVLSSSAEEQSAKLLREKEDSEVHFKQIYQQLEMKSKDNEDRLNQKIGIGWTVFFIIQ